PYLDGAARRHHRRLHDPANARLLASVQSRLQSHGLREARMSDASAAPPPKKANALFRVATWLITAGCFYLVYRRTEGAAAREGLTVLEYLVRFFGEANWLAWLALMIPYSVFFFLVDSHVTWRVVRWFNAPA